MKLSSSAWRAVIGLIVVVLAVTGWHTKKRADRKEPPDTARVIVVTNGAIRATIMTTGTVEPQNRLELKPTISGRADEILVREGDRVERGQIVAWISSTDRAALLDAARAQGKEAVAYWEQVYKASPLIAPIDGQVIVRDVEPGQTVTPNDAILVISDRLIVKADVDETDIGRVKVGQTADVALDAYPEVRAAGVVGHISYESKVANNVTLYETDIVLPAIPDMFKSGMSAEVTIVSRIAEDVALVPLDAVGTDEDGAFVRIFTEAEGETTRRILLGARDGELAEVTQGVRAGDRVVVRSSSYSPSEPESQANPFLPVGRLPKRERK